MNFAQVFQVNGQGHVKLSVQMDLSDRFLHPVFAVIVPPLIVLKIEVRRDLQQVLAREYLRHARIK